MSEREESTYRVFGGPGDPQSTIVAEIDDIRRFARTCQACGQRADDVAGVLGPVMGDLARVAPWARIDLGLRAGGLLARAASLRSQVRAHAEARRRLAVQLARVATAYEEAEIRTDASFVAVLSRLVNPWSGRLKGPERAQEYREDVDGILPRWAPIVGPLLTNIGGDLERFGELVHPAPDKDVVNPPPVPWVARRLSEEYPPQEVVAGPPRPAQVAARGAGVAGLISAIAETAREPGAVDVRRRAWVDVHGVRRESYLVTLPGTSRWDVPPSRGADGHVRTMAPNLLGVAGEVSEEARLLPSVLATAGVPPGAAVVLVGHSQGGMTALAAAGTAAMRQRYDVTQVITAGSPVANLPVPEGTRVVSLENRRDVVPQLDGAANRPRERHTTIEIDRESADATQAHAIEGYVDDATRLDARARDGLDAGSTQVCASLQEAGHLAAPGDVEISEQTTRVVLGLRQPAMGAGNVSM